jgi:hypothetical protein
MMKVHPGMSSRDILKMFGTPRNVSQEICGGATKTAWTCTTWNYGSWGEGWASFTFSGDTPDKLILNNFDIDPK